MVPFGVEFRIFTYLMHCKTNNPLAPETEGQGLSSPESSCATEGKNKAIFHPTT